MKRNTIQRQLVLDTVRRLCSHASAEEIYNEIIKEHPTVSRATVYRNLGVLADEGEIRRVEIPGHADRFDHCTSRHYHIHCIRCGKCEDIKIDSVTDFTAGIEDTHGYEIECCDIVIRGICPACIKKNGF